MDSRPADSSPPSRIWPPWSGRSSPGEFPQLGVGVVDPPLLLLAPQHRLDLCAGQLPVGRFRNVDGLAVATGLHHAEEQRTPAVRVNTVRLEIVHEVLA